MGIFTNTEGVKSFTLLNYPYEPVFQFVPIDDFHREKLYKSFEEMGIILPDYEQFKKKKFFNVRDLMVLRKDFEITFSFLGRCYKYVLKQGFFTDMASILAFVQMFRISKISEYSVIAALVHDASYGCKYFTQHLCDDLFESLLKVRKTPWLTKFLHMFFLRIFGGLTYNKSNSNSEFQLGFVELYCNDKLITPYTQIDK